MDRQSGRARAAAAAGMTSYTPSVQPASSQHHAEDDLLDRDIRAGAAQSVAVEAPRQHIAPVHSPQGPIPAPRTAHAAEAIRDGATAYHKLVAQSSEHPPLSIAAAELLARGWTPPPAEAITVTTAELLDRGWTPPRQAMPAMPMQEIGLESARSEKTVQWNDTVGPPLSSARQREEERYAHFHPGQMRTIHRRGHLRRAHQRQGAIPAHHLLALRGAATAVVRRVAAWLRLARHGYTRLDP
jgi:hypothetical protein